MQQHRAECNSRDLCRHHCGRAAAGVFARASAGRSRLPVLCPAAVVYMHAKRWQERMNEGLVERVELLDGIALLQRSPVGWHRYQHLVSQGSVGIGIKEDSRKNFIVASMVPGGAAQRAGTLCVGDVIVGVDDRTSSAFTLAQLAQALAGPVGTLCKILVEREQGVASSTIPILIRRSLSPSQPPQQTRPAQATPPATIISQPRSVMMPFNTGTAAADSTEEAERMYEQMQQMKLRQQQSQLSPSPQAPAAAVTTSSSRDLPVSLTKDIPGAGLEAADVTLHVTVVEGINLPPDATGSCCAAVQLQLLTAAATDVATHFVTATSGQLRAEWQADFEFTREREQLRQHAILRGALLVSRAPGGNDSSGGEHTIWGYFADIDLRALQFRPIEMWCSINLNTPYGNLDTDNQSINSGVPFVKLKLALKPLGARSAPSPPPRPSASPAVLYSPAASQQGRIVEVQRGQAAPGSTVGGIGVQYSKWASRVDPSIPWIISLVVADGPAHKAGVVQGESLLQVDGKEVSMLTTEQIRAMILGVPGSRVRLLLGPPVASPRE